MALMVGNRNQMILFPPEIEDYVGPEDPVRAYDAFIEFLDLREMGFIINPDQAGAHKFHPKEMLKIIVYGYSYGIRSSRKLERACHHNLSFMWLVSGLKPDYRTIARFRHDHKQEIKQVLKQNAKFCMEMNLIEGNTLFIDGSKFRANASINNTWDDEKCKKYVEIAEKNIERIMDEVEQIDKEEDGKGTLVKLEKELKNQKKLQEKVQKVMRLLTETGKEKINSTDIDAVNAKGRQGIHAIHNCQAGMDEKHGLIVHCDSVSKNNDLNQFSPQVEKAKENMEKYPKNAVTDAGYFSLVDLEKAPEEVKVIIPSRKQAQKDNKKVKVKPFGIEEFKYNKESDEYICPEGKSLTFCKIAFGDKNKLDYKAAGKDCRACKHFGICTSSRNGRHVIRMKENEELKAKLEEIYNEKESQALYKLRKEKAELQFGHMKYNLGAGHLLLRGTEGANAEFSILSTCFNMARMITIFGIPMLIAKLNGM